MSNVFGGGSSFANQGNDDYGTDSSGWDFNPMKRAFGLDPFIDSSGINRTQVGKDLGGSFSNYNVKSPYELNLQQDELDRFKPGPALQHYIDYSGQTPKREDYQPSGWAKLVATMAGASSGYKDPAAGIKNALAVREEPYRRATSDYEARLKDMHDAAALESQAENYEAMSGYRNYGAVTGRFRANAQARSADERNALNRDWNLARVDQFGKTNAQKAAELGETVRSHGVTEKETGRHNVAGEKIGQTNAATGQTVAATGQKRETAYEADVTGKNKARADAAKGKGAKGPSPAEIDKARNTAASEIATTEPDKYGSFTDKFGHTIPPAGWLGGRTSNPTYQEFITRREKRAKEILSEKYPSAGISTSSGGVDQVVDY
jgi:hypothetical protein